MMETGELRDCQLVTCRDAFLGPQADTKIRVLLTVSSLSSILQHLPFFL